MNTAPLFDASSSNHVAFHRGRFVSAAEFAATAESLLTAWPHAKHAINLCENRYYFLLAFVVACIRGQRVLLPPNRAPVALEALQSNYPECCILDDDDLERRVRQGDARTKIAPAPFDEDRIVALTFTSGSTGVPTAHEKSWRLLKRNAELAADEVLGGRGSQIVATVPAQHVYGLETSVITALVSGCTVYDGKPFFPADVQSALESIKSPRTLVTTPTHLRVMIEAGTRMPELQRVVSATAALPIELAMKIEDAWQTEVFEIYGCTEAGVVANRRTVHGARWRTFSGGKIAVRDGAATYFAPQLPSEIPLQDIIEPSSPTEFHLHGRQADLIKVAGKRASLEALTRELLGIDGVKDAVIFVPETDARPAALAVAPQKSVADLLSALQQRIDPAFLPRPLVLVDRLPRNEVGKLPRAALLQALRRSDDERGILIRSKLCVPHSHPSLPGHFPGRPVVPGVVLLDLIVAGVKEVLGDSASLSGVSAAKFIRPVEPEQTLDIECELNDDATGWQARVSAASNGQQVLTATIRLSSSSARSHG